MNRTVNRIVCFVAWGICAAPVFGQAEKEQRDETQRETAQREREESNPHQEMMRRLEVMKRRIAELRANDRQEEAADLEREAMGLIQKSQSYAGRDFPDKIHKQIEALLKEGRNEEANNLERKVRENRERERKAQAASELDTRAREALERERARFPGERPESGPADQERRLHHLREAAENLVAAGLPEQAEQLRRQADALRARFNARGERPAELQELHQQIREQNERIERLEQMIHKLMQKSDATKTSESDSASSKTIAWVQAMIKKHDKNGDGSLTKDEWSTLSHDPSPADYDKNGAITPEEYLKWTLSQD